MIMMLRQYGVRKPLKESFTPMCRQYSRRTMDIGMKKGQLCVRVVACGGYCRLLGFLL